MKKQNINHKCQAAVEEVINKIAEEYGLSTSEVRTIYVSQFKCAKSVINRGRLLDRSTFKSVLLPKIGRILPNHRAISKGRELFLKKLKEEKGEEDV